MSGIYDTVQNPIPYSGLWTEPTLEEIQAFIEALPKKERTGAYMVMMYTLNRCHRLVEDNILNKEIFA
jgi:hypothetical protein